MGFVKTVLGYVLPVVTQINKDTPLVPKLLPSSQLTESRFDSSRRLLVYQREYLVFEKTFSDFEGLQDWLAINTLHSHQAIDVLCTKGHVNFGEGVSEEFLQLEHELASHLSH